MPSLSKEELVEGFRVQTIQEAALRVISRRGLAGATMQEIADEAGVAKGTIYLYFGSRDALLQRSAEVALSKLLETLEATMETPRPFAAQLRALIEAKLKFFDAQRDFFRLYVAVTQGELAPPSRARRRHQAQYEVHLGRLAAFFGEARQRGDLAPLDPVRLALFVAEGMNAIILRRLSEEAPPPVESEVEWIVRTLTEGISAKGRAR